MDLVLTESDRRQFSAGQEGTLRLGSAFTARFLSFWVPISIPALGFRALCIAVAVPSSRFPVQLQGIACFRFLNRFTYGNFGETDQFGLELP
jgi:hypothetical protein